MSASLKRAIDRMVEDAIRRILPSVMNEVLVATIARGTADVVTEERPIRPRRGPKKRKPVREQRGRPAIERKAARPSPKGRKAADLRELLTVDDSAGAEFYRDPSIHGVAEGFEREPEDDDDGGGDDETPAPIARRIQALPPELQGLAEGLNLDDDDGEMWGAGEYDSGESIPTRASEVRNIDEAARRVGVDFSRMKAVIGATSPVKRVDRDDVKAQAQFEQARLNRMRERLNGGKPIE